MNVGDRACPETRPCPHPSPGGRKPARTLVGKADGTDVLLGNVESQHHNAAQLNTHANASCESFMKTLKREEIYANKYDDLEHLRANIEEFIEQYYNRLRLHSALGYQSPEEFEQRSESLKVDTRSATMEFFENRCGAPQHLDQPIRCKIAASETEQR
ncbi:MAG TPA: integrase core domain-containing protein [Terriglobales bacterium]|nr:integrase core domain-containing protein [Terriglobales bacterium]